MFWQEGGTDLPRIPGRKESERHQRGYILGVSKESAPQSSLQPPASPQRHTVERVHLCTLPASSWLSMRSSSSASWLPVSASFKPKEARTITWIAVRRPRMSRSLSKSCACLSLTLYRILRWDALFQRLCWSPRLDVGFAILLTLSGLWTSKMPWMPGRLGHQGDPKCRRRANHPCQWLNLQEQEMQRTSLGSECTLALYIPPSLQ